MKRRIVLLTGIVGPLFLVGLCIAAVLLLSIAAWLFDFTGETAYPIRIAPLAPLTTGTAVSASPPAQPSPTPAPENGALTAIPGTFSVPDTSPQSEASGASPPTSEIERALGFSLPQGSVNSITQEGVATRLVIPKLNLDAPIVIAPIKDQTWQVDHLGQAVGHLEGTAPPGSNSNVVLAGHITLGAGVYGPFAGLGRLSPGDLITIYQDGEQFNYVVDGQQVVDRTAVEVTYPTNTPQVTLITCDNWNNETGRYEQRLVVTGHLVQ